MVDDWNDELIGAEAEDLTPPVGPESVEVNVTQTRVQVLWESPAEGDSASGSDESPDEGSAFYVGEDWDEIVRQGGGAITADLTPESFSDETQDILGFDVEPDEEIDYFQVQLATDATFLNIIRHDRMVRGHTRTWRVRKPSTTTYYARVRSVDILGNKSDWVTNSLAQDIVGAPTGLVLDFEAQANPERLKAILTVDNVPDYEDEDISRYHFQLREVDFVRIDGAITAASATVVIASLNDETPISYPFTAFIEDEEVTVTNITGGGSLTWHITRGANSTTAAAHADGKRIWFFGRSGKHEGVVVTEDEDDTVTLAIIRNCDEGVRYRARVRAIDSQNRKGPWSGWTSSIKAADGASTGGGGGTPTPSPYDYPYERVIRLESDVSEGFTSAVFNGLRGAVTAARAVVGTAATTGALSISIELDTVSFLTLTVPINETQSDMTWVTPPLYIGQQTGQSFIPSQDITVTQTTMQDAASGLTVYLYVYLDDGS